MGGVGWGVGGRGRKWRRQLQLVELVSPFDVRHRQFSFAEWNRFTLARWKASIIIIIIIFYSTNRFLLRASRRVEAKYVRVHRSFISSSNVN